MVIEDMDKILQQLPREPARFEEWIRQKASPNYLIYDREKNIMVCTACGKEIKGVPKGAYHHSEKRGYFSQYEKESEMRRCPKCGTKAFYKSAGMGRQGLSDGLRVLLLTRKGKVVYGTLWEVDLDYRPFGRPELRRSLSAVYVIKDNNVDYYKRYRDWQSGEIWRHIRKARMPKPPGAMMWMVSRYANTFIYRKNLKSVFTGSCLKYLWDEQFVNMLSEYGLINYIRKGLRNPAYEMLAKAGFRTLALQGLDSDIRHEYNISLMGKSLPAIMKLSMGDIRKIRQHDPTAMQIAVYRELPERYREIVPWNILKHWHPGEAEERIKWIERHVKAKRFFEWASQFDNPHYVVTDWFDYINMANNLGWELERKKVLLPDDFEAAHAKAQEMTTIVENKTRDESIRKRMLGIRFETEDMVIIEADSQYALNKESAELHHCVKTYGDKLEKGKCRIFLIRMKDEPNTPFYTLETKMNGEFVQCRGDHNCSMTPEVKKLKDDFIKHLQKELKKKARKAA